jgi:hypothetical protein
MAELIEVEDVANIKFKEVESESEVDTSRYYINDDEYTAAMTEWRYKCNEAKASGQERPPLPDYIGECVDKAANSMSKRHNYCGYSYVDEMIGDAVFHCVKYLHNFDPSKTNKKGKVSAFSYTNMIITRSFNNRIESEKKQQYLKYASYNLMGGNEAFGDEVVESDDSDEAVSVGILGADFMNKAQEYESKYGLNKKVKEQKIISADLHMFDMFSSPEKREQE